MFISRIRAPFTKAEPVGQSYFSDIHLGCPEFQEKQLKSDLQEAADNGDRIVIGGDTFDAILPSDKKRYKPESVHPRLYGTSKILDDQVDWAEEIFAPFANLIDGFGLGNHETAVEKHHASDLSARLIRRVQSHVTDKKHRIHYLGYIGFLDYRFERGKQRADCKVANNTRRLVVFYHHGAGGQAPVTKGMIDFNRKQTWVNSDVIWLQHKHNNVADTGALRLSCPMKGLEPVARPQVCFMTPSYMKTYGPGRGGYASDWGLSPTNNGYARLLIDLSGDSGIQRDSAGALVKLMQIEWRDAYGDGGEWIEQDEIETGVVLVHTVGWLVDQTEAGITLAQSWAEDDGINAFFNYMTIPKGMILGMREIKET